MAARLPLLFALVLAAGVLAPLMMAATISLNPDEQAILIQMGSWRTFLPAVVSARNFVEVWTDPVHSFPRYFLNTVLIAGSTTGLSVAISSMAGFVLAQGDIGGRRLLAGLVLATLAIPGESLVLPLLILAARAGLIDSYAVQILPGTANAVAILLFYRFFARLPRELIEAARLDGLSFFQIYRHIAMPLSRPVIAAVAMLQVLEVWNSYLWPVMVTRGPEHRPLSVAMSAYLGTNQAAWGNVMAFALSMAIPTILLFLILERHFTSALSGGEKP